MAYGSGMNLNQMNGFGPVRASFGTFQTTTVNPYQASPLLGGQNQMMGMLMQLLQAFSSLQNSWSQSLGQSAQVPQAYTPAQVPFPGCNSPQAFQPAYQAPAYQAPVYQAPAPAPAPAPAYEAPAPAPAVAYAEPAPAPAPAPEPAVNVAVAVNVEPPAPVVEVNQGGGGDGGDGGDPVILDLNGDNKLDVTGADGGKINFNLFGNGTNVKTEWLKAGTEDGLLVSDFDGDGKIDSGRELMRTTGVNGEQGKYKGGWDKLSQLFDKNKDGKVSGDELNELQVWVDKNGDGISDEGELRSVKDLGISQIDIPAEGVKSNFTMNGKQQMAEDYVFDLAK
ncbi:MAG: hypothetical protein J0I12_18875 [Candidatus Eremiobacteraeota bacterium]|nr:hypothetical protein [Candidatus Eremiobacteraeota bacterium]